MSVTTQAPQRRYDVLIKLIEKGMLRSRRSLDTTELVKASYGDDASVFGDPEMLAGTMDDMLDRLHEQVLQQDLPAYLEDHSIQGLMNRVEGIVEALDREEAAQAQVEQEDQESAIRSMDASLLPAGITLESMIDYHKYQHAVARKEQMTEALQQIQNEIESLENNQAEMKDRVKSQQEVLKQTAKELGQSADICSMVVSS